jgi:hypothetical protein
MTLEGKGFFIWQIPRCDGGNPSAIAARASAAGLSHVLIKISDGSNKPYNYDPERKVDLVPPVRDALKAAGVSVWGWSYVRGDNPVAEAGLAVRRMLELDLDGFVVNAEIEFKQRGRRESAKRLMAELRAGLPSAPIALSSFRYPTAHRAFPFAEFLEQCDYVMPQVYFEKAHNPEQQLDRSVEEFSALQPARPVIPTAPAYVTSGWRPTPEELKRFLTKSKAMGLTAVNAWSWDYATRPAFVDLWQAIADFEWPAESMVSNLPEKLIEFLNLGDPSKLVDLYVESAAHVTGERTVTGCEAIEAWYRSLLSETLPNAEFTLTGKSGHRDSCHFTWVAVSDRGEVRDGSDTLGLRDGRIVYHYTYFTIR